MTKRATKQAGPGWINLTVGKSKCGIRWMHEPSSWVVQHCGHPTANFPYALYHPQYPTDTVVSFNGYGFKTVTIARAVVEGIVEGRYHVTSEHCNRGTRRVRGITGLGDQVREE